MQALFARDQSILDALNQFQLEQRQLLGTNAEYLLVNAVREMSRLYYIEAMKPRVTTLVKAVIDSSSKEDSSRAIWLAAAEMADYYDRSQCDYYGICGFKYQLEQDTLSFNWKCSDTLKMRAQDLYQDQASWICEVLSDQEAYFHSKLETSNTPVSEDNNDDLELVIFNSSGDYQSFAGSFFGINTDNGGMYLEARRPGSKIRPVLSPMKPSGAAPISMSGTCSMNMCTTWMAASTSTATLPAACRPTPSGGLKDWRNTSPTGMPTPQP